MTENAKIRVAYFDTDAMGVVHHSNYLRFFEVARVHYMKQMGLDYSNATTRGWHFPLVESHCRYRRPAKFDDVLEIKIKASWTGTRFVFEYEVFRDQILLTTGYTHHVCVDNNLTRITPPAEIMEIFSE